MTTHASTQLATGAPNLAAATPIRTAVCPFCAEEIHERAIRCKHCRSDLVKTCAACREPMPLYSVQCRRCGTYLSSTPALPFAPVPGATPVSGIVFFFVALLTIILSAVVGPAGPVLVVLGTSIWVAFDAHTHKLSAYDNNVGGPATACIGSLLLWIVAFPWYLAIRSRIRAGIQPVKV
jgi:Double zinc ribbon